MLTNKVHSVSEKYLNRMSTYMILQYFTIDIFENGTSKNKRDFFDKYQIEF